MSKQTLMICCYRKTISSCKFDLCWGEMKLLVDDAENVEKHLLKGLFFHKIEAPVPLKSIKQSFFKDGNKLNVKLGTASAIGKLFEKDFFLALTYDCRRIIFPLTPWAVLRSEKVGRRQPKNN